MAAVAEALHELHDQSIVLPQLRAVADFEGVEKLRHALNEAMQALRVGVVQEEMVENIKKIALPQVRHQFLAIRPQLLNLPVMSLVEPVYPDVNLVAEFGKVSADFLAHHEIRNVAQAVEDFQAAVDGVVVGDGDQVHATLLGRAIDVQRVGITVPAAEKPQVFRRPRVPRVDVHVGFEKLCRLPFNHAMLY